MYMCIEGLFLDVMLSTWADAQVAMLRHRKWPEVLDLPNVSSAKWTRRGLKLHLATSAQKRAFKVYLKDLKVDRNG